MIHQTWDENGVLIEEWNDQTRTHYWNFDGNTGTEPYTPEQNAEADARAAAETQMANRVTIEAALAAALATLQAILDTPNATINATPAPYLKDLARVQKRLIRRALSRFDAAD